jgi:hypothetical protein
MGVEALLACPSGGEPEASAFPRTTNGREIDA